MSLYHLQKFLYVLNRDEAAQSKFRDDIEGVLGEYDLTTEESAALRDGDIGLLYVLGVNGQILMHFAAFLDAEGEFFDTIHFPKSLKQYPFRGYGVYLIMGKVEEELGFPSITVDKRAKLPVKPDPRN